MVRVPGAETKMSTPFSKRSNKCCVLSSFNNNLNERVEDCIPSSYNDDLQRLLPARTCQIEILGSYPKPGFRFMSDRVENRCLVLEAKIKKFAEALAAKEHRKVSHNVAYASQDSVIVVGRVCCDGEGHLNEKSILLEGSADYSSGQRVQVDLRDIALFSIFPGQILGVEGKNPSGYCIVASRIFDVCPLSTDLGSIQKEEPPPKRQERPQPGCHQVTPEVARSMSIVVASGPFTGSDNLYYEPLVDLLAYARRKQPMVLLLIGPFVDLEHPVVKQGLIDKSFAQIFEEELLARVEEYCKEMGSARVVLVPSLRDAHHDFVFPQPPFAYNFEDPSEQITLLPNPSVFRCDQVTMGCCSTDILRHLSSEEISRTPANVSRDRMTRLACHIIAQQSFYPLFPAPVGTALDLTMASEALTISSIPDILFMPSDLAPFVKVLSVPLEYKSDSQGIEDYGKENEQEQDQNRMSSLCINPGRLTKGTSGGTFAEILILPGTRDKVSVVEDAVNARTKVLITRI